jgi:hypothetical protein
MFQRLSLSCKYQFHSILSWLITLEDFSAGIKFISMIWVQSSQDKHIIWGETWVGKCVYQCVCVHIHTCMYIHVCVCVCMYVNIIIHIHNIQIWPYADAQHWKGLLEMYHNAIHLKEYHIWPWNLEDKDHCQMKQTEFWTFLNSVNISQN